MEAEQYTNSNLPILNVFKRKEKKYALTKDAYERIIDVIEAQMVEDEHGQSTICSIYYDNDQFELINKSIQKPFYKEKFRIRSYGVAKDDTPVFAEIKKKLDGIVYKRRVTAPCAQLMDFLAQKTMLPDHPQIQKEIIYMLDRYHLSPKVFIGCDRMAYFGKDDPNLRITFDTKLRYRTDDLDLRCGDHGTFFYNEPRYIMEIKIPGATPLWLSHLLTAERIYPGSFSKVGTAYQEHIFPAAYAQKASNF